MNFIRGIALCATLLSCFSSLSLGYSVDQSEVKLNLKQVERDADSGVFSVHIDANDKEHKLQLQKADVSSHSSVKVAFANTDKEGKLVLNEWSPSQEELAAAHDFYVDDASKAALRIKEKDGQYTVNGVFNGYSIKHDGVDHSAYIVKTPRNDMRRIPEQNRSTTESPSTDEPLVKADNDFNYIVELMIFCDMELGQTFGFNRQKILDYWTVFMWDVNNRFKTVQGVKLSFKTVSVIVAQSKSAQQFIEDARDPKTGKAEHGRILDQWRKWAPQQTNLPKSDMVGLASETEMDWGGGLAWVGAVCDKNGLNVASWNEYGLWTTISVAAHEMGHNMGADHDEYEQGACKDHIYHGYIEADSNQDLRFFFSPCSDRSITQAVLSKEKECLKQLDQPGEPAVREFYDSPLAPSLDVQCRVEARDNGAKYKSNYGNICKLITCQRGNGDTFDILPLENAPCNASSPNARCFRGNCREKGFLFKNVGSGLCMMSVNPFTHWARNKFVKCPKYAGPLERLVVRTDDKGSTLASPYAQGDDTKETGDKCMWAGTPPSGSDVTDTLTDRCGDYTNPWHRWDIEIAGKGVFVIKHRITGSCIRPLNNNPEGSEIATDKNCQRRNRNFQFVLLD